METLVLHPEELFDKAARGLATADELARLDGHLATCTTCRFERQVRMDFEAVGGSTADVDDLVARALSGAQQVPEAPRRRRIGPFLIAATIALMGFGSFAAVAKFTGLFTPLSLAPEGERVGVRGVPQTIAEPPRPKPQPEPEPEPEAKLEPKPKLKPRAKAEVGAPTVIPAEPNAIAIFSRATQERVTGETTLAIQDFQSVITKFPGSPEAALSQAALGRLFLDRGDATSALSAFDAYLASTNQLLREDVQGARAMALQALGRADEERSAWEAVLHDYPAGVYAPRARTRLESLNP